MTWFLVAFLTVHGLLHLAIWMPQPPPHDHAVPFQPDQSALLTASGVPQVVSHRWVIRLASAAAATYLIGALALAVGLAAAPGTVAVAAALGLVLKTVYFHPWLAVGIALDALVVTSALLGWPMTLG